LYFSCFIFPSLLNAQTSVEVPLRKIAFISDTQAPMWIEDVFLKSHNNEVATEILLNDAVNKKPDLVIFPGDLVNLGCNQKRWKMIDSCLLKFSKAGIPYHGCLGNHELMKRKKKGEKNFQERFPDHVNTGNVFRYDSIAIVLLNSNFKKMNRAQVEKQDEWYKNVLMVLDSSPDIKAVIVSCHHSPYSDSKLVGSSEKVQEKFVPGYINSAKARLFITGHAHLFQHFNISNKDFLVIGGGLNHPLKSKSCGHKDLSAEYKPMFHYVLILDSTSQLKVISMKLKEDFSGVEEGRSFKINLSTYPSQ
jgi:Icc-related predicted phosphoesterase